MDSVRYYESGNIRLSYGRADDKVYLTLFSDSDPSFSILKADEQEVQKSTKIKTANLCACVHAPTQPLIITGDRENNIKCYHHTDLNKETFLTRLPLPPRCLAFSPCGKHLFATGDAEQIKIVEIESKKVLRTMIGSAGVRGMCCDPEGRFLAMTTALGAVEIWDIHNHQCVYKKPSLARKVIRISGDGTIRIAWHPKGTFLCIPGPTNNILFIERESWRVMVSKELSYFQKKPITALAFSPNGLYLVSGSEDCTVCVFNHKSQELIVMKNVQAAVADLAWHPIQPQLAIGTAAGRMFIFSWNDLCHDDEIETPIEAIDDEDSRNSDKASEAGSASGMPLADGMEGHKRTRCAYDPLQSFSRISIKPRHPVIHPGSTEKCQHNKPFFFCWNYAGQLVVQSSARNSSIQILTKESRTAPFLDFTGFVMGSLGLSGAFFASAGKGDAEQGCKNAKLHFRGFYSVSEQSNWELDLLKEEQPICLASGDMFCAVCTSRHLLRLFSISGLQLAIFSIPENVICLIARGPFLALFYENVNSGICYKLYNIDQKNLHNEGPADCSRMIWAGFSSQGILCIMDQSLTLKMLTPSFGGSWIPVFEGQVHVKQPEEDLFIIDVSDSEVVAVVHKKRAPPQVTSIPNQRWKRSVVCSQVQPPSMISDFKFSVPFLTDTGLEQDLLLCEAFRDTNLENHGVRRDTKNASSCYVKKQEAHFGEVLLTMYNNALKQKNGDKGLDLVKLMTEEKYVEGALRLAKHHQMHKLAQEITKILENLK